MTGEFLIFENAIIKEITPARIPQPDDSTNIIQPPTLRTRKELDSFIEALSEAGDRVFGPR